MPAPIIIMQSPIKRNCSGVGKKYLKINRLIIKKLCFGGVFRAAAMAARTYPKQGRKKNTFRNNFSKIPKFLKMAFGLVYICSLFITYLI